MSRPPEPVFLERQSYRLRRLGDAAKVLPILGAVLMVLPVLWADDARTGGGLIYVFGVWAFLIVLMFVVSRRLRDAGPDTQEAEQDPPREV